jgi:aryl-alcohol dehydrogenase-like predicted oxidoreductase
MQYRTLGKTGLEVSEIGFGTWQLADSPGMWTGATPEESLAALHRYAELGGNFIDTAWDYGMDPADLEQNPDMWPEVHPSEALIGHFLLQLPPQDRDKIIVATKVPPIDMVWPAARGVPAREIFPDKHVKRCVDESLRNLGLESLKLVQFHAWQDYFADEDEWRRTIEELTADGKVEHWGISLNDYQPSNCLQTLRSEPRIETIQTIFNIFHQNPAVRLLPTAAELNVGIIGRVPLDEGGLSGNFTRETIFDEGDWRRDYFAGMRMDELVERTDALKKLTRPGESLAQFALRYVISFDAVSTTIPGMRKVRHVEANAAASDGNRLDSWLIELLKHHKWERNFCTWSNSLDGPGYMELDD